MALKRTNLRNMSDEEKKAHRRKINGERQKRYLARNPHIVERRKQAYLAKKADPVWQEAQRQARLAKLADRQARDAENARDRARKRAEREQERDVLASLMSRLMSVTENEIERKVLARVMARQKRSKTAYAALRADPIAMEAERQRDRLRRRKARQESLAV